MAWRDIRHAPGRSALVVALIALPIFALSAADVLVHTMELTSSEQVNRELGDAQAAIFGPPARESSPIEQDPGGLSSGGFASSARKILHPAAITPAYLLAHLPAGSRLITAVSGEWTITTRYGITTSGVTDTDYADPALARLTTQVSGRQPANPGEVALTTALAHKIGRTVGQAIVDTQTKRSYTVVGLVKARYDPTAQQAYVAPATLTSLIALAGSTERDYFIASNTPVTWPMVLVLNHVGIVVMSRYVAAHPPARAAVPYYVSQSFGATSSSAGLTTIALLGGMVVLEIVLLAGPAFTVGARRMRRTLGLIGAVGGSRHDLRNVVLAGGVLLGLAAGIVGSGLGVVAGIALVPAYAHWQDRVPGPTDLRPLELGALVAVSVATGLMAAWLPARHAARSDILASLRGRRGTVRTKTGRARHRGDHGRARRRDRDRRLGDHGQPDHPARRRDPGRARRDRLHAGVDRRGRLHRALVAAGWSHRASGHGPQPIGLRLCGGRDHGRGHRRGRRVDPGRQHRSA